MYELKAKKKKELLKDRKTSLKFWTSYEEKIKLKKKILRDSKLDMIIYWLTEIEEDMENIGILTKELVHKTEYWERGNPVDFLKIEWEELKKIRAWITKKLNIVIQINNNIKEERELWQKQEIRYSRTTMKPKQLNLNLEEQTKAKI